MGNPFRDPPTPRQAFSNHPGGEIMNIPAVAFSPDSADKASERRGGKYLTFTLAEEEYGISITKIREIIGMMPVTRVPRTNDFVKGVINLRGRVIPIMDLRLRFGMEEIPHTDRTCIVIVEVLADRGTVQMGIIVDSVSEVLNIQEGDVEAPPDLSAGDHTRYILGMAKMEESVKILIDIDKVLGDKEAREVARAARS
jgi:purine-binding chemotaxis protein CheW